MVWAPQDNDRSVLDLETAEEECGVDSQTRSVGRETVLAGGVLEPAENRDTVDIDPPSLWHSDFDTSEHGENVQSGPGSEGGEAKIDLGAAEDSPDAAALELR